MNRKIVVVVGGSSGIGKATCDRLKEEYTVVNMSRRKNNELENIYCDVENYDSVVNGFKQLIEIYGVPEIMVYSAGFVDVQGLMEIDYETLIKTYKVNIIGAFIATQQFAKYVDKTKDNKIIYVSSTSSERASPGWSAYSSSKSSINNFSLTANEELKNYNVKTYCILCGRCNTELRKRLVVNEDFSKIMQPSEVAEVIYTLIKDKNLLDGQNLIVRKSLNE